MDKINYLSAEGMENLKSELKKLKTKGRAEMAQMIQEAREKGDLSENAEYDAAKAAQQLLELKISKLETALSVSRVIDTSTLDNSKVIILSKVNIQNKKTGSTVTYQIVSEEEADLKSGKISVNSPIGKGLLGKKKGQVAKIKTPSGILEYNILSISIE